MVSNRYSVITLLLSLWLAACGGLQAGLEPATASPANTTVPVLPTATSASPATSLPPAGTATPGAIQTFYNNTVGFQLDVPADWIIERQTVSPGPVTVDTLA